MRIDLTRQETAALKGIAIVCIALHNFFHLLPFTVKENEYTFALHKTRHVWLNLLQGADYMLADFFSHFGHYGVPVFLFVSGYGLVKKYEGHLGPEATRPSQTVPLGGYVRYNLLKLWRLMLPAYFLYMIVDTLIRSRFRFTVMKIVGQLTFTANLFPEPQTYTMPGPFWYFGLTVQLYLVYRLLFMDRGKSMLAGSVLVCLLLQAGAMIWFESPMHNVLNYLRYNCFGSMLPFVVGVWTARYDILGKWRHTVPRWHYLIYFILATSLLCISGFNRFAWLLAPLFVIWLSVSFVKLLPGIILSSCAWLGGISAAIFVLHPTFRDWLLPKATTDNCYLVGAAYLILTALASWGYTWMLRKWNARRKKA